MEKYLSFDKIKSELQKNSNANDSREYWRVLVLGTLENLIEVGQEFNITSEDVDKIVDNLFKNNTIIEVIDEEMFKELEKYRKKEDNSNVETRFVVMEDWKIDSGESGIYSSVFSSFEKALKYYNNLKENYEIDYELKDRDEDEFNVDEEINVDSKFASIEVTFNNSCDYYKIWIDEKKVDEF